MKNRERHFSIFRQSVYRLICCEAEAMAWVRALMAEARAELVGLP